MVKKKGINTKFTHFTMKFVTSISVKFVSSWLNKAATRSGPQLQAELIFTVIFPPVNQSTIRCTVASSNIGIVQPYMFEPDINSPAEEEELHVFWKFSLRDIKLMSVMVPQIFCSEDQGCQNLFLWRHWWIVCKSRNTTHQTQPSCWLLISMCVTIWTC